MPSLQLQSLFGLFCILAIAWLLSEDRRLAWRPKLIIVAVGLQVLLALAFTRIPQLQGFFSTINQAVLALQAASEAGTSMVFGYLGGAALPFEENRPGASFILAFRVLPLVIVISSITSLLVYWRILPWIITLLSRLLHRVLGIGGAVSLGTAANIFVGMVEAPLFIRPHIQQLSRNELFIIMVAGMATIAGTVLVLYASVIQHVLENAAGHLLLASLISAPAAIIIAQLMVPAKTKEQPQTTVAQLPPQNSQSSMDAITQGASNGLQLYLNIIAMLIVLVALVHLVNSLLGLLPHPAEQTLSLEYLLGLIMAPITWLMGIPWQEASTAGALMGTKTILNEFLAYLQLSSLPAEALSDRSRLIMTYALCGFANLGSLGIMLAGLTTMAPERRQEIIALGPKSVIAGTLATCCTGAVIGLLTPA